MNNYLNLIPEELITIISSYLSYNEICIIRKIYDVNIDYFYLLKINYPAFNEIFRIVKNLYITYSYEFAYASIDKFKLLTDSYGKNIINNTLLRTSDILIFEKMINNISIFEEFYDFYEILELYNSFKKEYIIYFEYLEYFPKINGMTYTYIISYLSILKYPRIDTNTMSNYYLNSTENNNRPKILTEMFLRILLNKTIIKNTKFFIVGLKELLIFNSMKMYLFGSTEPNEQI